jgi:aconitate hydratase/homoaconitate hydratase
MQITDPRPLLAMVDQSKYRRILGERKARRTPELQLVQPALHLATQGVTVPGLQAVTEAELSRQRAAQAARAKAAEQGAGLRSRVQRFGDNVDTDAIIPGAFCHLTKLEDLGAKAFAVVRPDFPAKAAAGARVVVAGEGWGSGSSREQAVLALKGAGIACVIAKSYAFIHKRNLVNEAVPFLLVKDPAFYEAAGEGVEVEVDLFAGRVGVAGAWFQAQPPSKIIRALGAEGGIVPAIQRNGVGVFEKLVS